MQHLFVNWQDVNDDNDEVEPLIEQYDEVKPLTETNNVRKLRETLRKIVDPSLKMLNLMVSGDILTSEQMEKILTRKTVNEKNDELLLVFMKTGSDVLDKILDILNNTGQGHVANYIRSGGGKLFDKFHRPLLLFIVVTPYLTRLRNFINLPRNWRSCPRKPLIPLSPTFV